MQTMNVVYLALPLAIHALTAAVLDINNVWEQMSPWHKCQYNLWLKLQCKMILWFALPQSVTQFTSNKFVTSDTSLLIPGADGLKCFAKVTLLVGKKSNQILLHSGRDTKTPTHSSACSDNIANLL